MKKAAIYMRFANSDALTVLCQTDRCLEYAVQQHYEVEGVYSDVAVSGLTAERPEFQRMMDGIDNWDLVIVPKIADISRDADIFYNFIQTMKQTGKEILSVMEGIVSFESLEILQQLKERKDG